MVVVSEVAADAFIWIEAHFLIKNEMKEKEVFALARLLFTNNRRRRWRWQWLLGLDSQAIDRNNKQLRCSPEPGPQQVWCY